MAGLILAQTTARFVGAEEYPGLTAEVVEAVTQALVEAWGTEDLAALNAPSRSGDERFRRWYARYSRSMASPRTVEAYARSLTTIDVRDLLDRLDVPTVVLHRVGWPLVPVDQARYLAEHIEGATLVELPGSDGALFWEEPDLTIETVRGFLATLAGSGVERRRILATILFTDIVDSTGRAAALGDRAWRAVLDTHDEVVRSIVDMAGGRVVKTTGDGVLATFPEPEAAIASTERIRAEVRTLGLEIRAGLHTGEVEERGADVGGMGVHIASRVMGVADAGEILVSRTVRDLVTGTDRRFEHRGERDLKGVDGPWELYEVVPSR